MTIDPRITAYRNTPNKSYRQNVPRKGVCLHHGALTNFAYLRELAMGAKQVSATNIVKDNNNEQLMTDQFRAWSLSSAWGDSSFRTVETCNESTNGWTISDESHWTLARLIAYWAQRDGFWPHRSGPRNTWTVLGHREVYEIYGESYATACPGGMDLDLATERAQGLLKAAAAPATANTLEDEMEVGYYAKNTKTGSIFWISRARGTKRHITSTEWAAARAHENLSGEKLIVVSLTDAQADAIPNA